MVTAVIVRIFFCFSLRQKLPEFPSMSLSGPFTMKTKTPTILTLSKTFFRRQSTYFRYDDAVSIYLHKSNSSVRVDKLQLYNLLMRWKRTIFHFS